jgi:hypothetical protein
MESALTDKLRYSVCYQLRYLHDLARARAQHRAPAVCRILIASDNLSITSEQQFAPLLAHRRLISDELGVVFDQRLLDDVLDSRKTSPSSYAAVFAKLSFRTPDLEAIDKIKRLRRLFPSPIKLFYFDGDDDLCVQWGALLETVDVYVKKHIFSDKRWYTKRFVGKSNLTEYAASVTGRSFADDPIPVSGTVSDDFLGRIVLGYNIGLDDKIAQLLRHTRPASASSKDIDVMCRAAASPADWIYPLRGTISQALRPLERDGYQILMPDRRVDQRTYYEEMRRSRICVSPFGYGEICWRDFEAVLMGSLLVKPDMNHVRTEPNIFIPEETYVPVRWDFSDLAEVCVRWLADERARTRVITRAYEVLTSYYSDLGVLKCLRRLLAEANLAPFTGETRTSESKEVA